MLTDNLAVGLSVGFVALVAASVTDLKTREVPDWLNFALTAFAIGYAILLSIFHSNIGFLVNALAGLIVGLAVGLFMFYTGQWGGGDSKLMIGLSALIGMHVPFLSNLGGDYRLIIFLVNTLFVGAVYGLLFSAWKAVSHFREWKEEAISKLKQKSVRITKIVLLIFMIGALVNYVLAPGFEAAFLVGVSVLMMLMLYLWVFVSSVEKVHMVRQFKVKDLTEGDWVVEPVMKGKKTVLKPTRTGITREEIALLKKNSIRDVVIKVGIPFVPSFLVAYIVTLAFGNWIAFFI